MPPQRLVCLELFVQDNQVANHRRVISVTLPRFVIMGDVADPLEHASLVGGEFQGCLARAWFKWPGVQVVARQEE